MTIENLGIQRLDHVDFVVSNYERSKEFYHKKMGMSFLGELNSDESNNLGEKSAWFEASRVQMKVSSPTDKSSNAGKFLASHPDGIRTIAMRVEDIHHAYKVLGERGAAISTEITGDANRKEFRIASPLGDVEFAFIERKESEILPSTYNHVVANGEAANPHQFTHMDHITSNTKDMRSLTRWYEEVLGFEHFWDIRFHTRDANPDHVGSGLNSIVMREPSSNIKFATNEPLGPNFYGSQIQKFVEDNHGAGVQHIALSTKAIMDVIPQMNSRGLQFLDTPDSYYKMLPSRLAERAVENMKETIEDIQARKIQVDGRENRYLLQIFMKEAALLYNEAAAGPFFYEVIQRHGEQGFGEGNFRALFESIERQQNAKDDKIPLRIND